MDSKFVMVESGKKSFREPINREVLNEIISADFQSIHKPLSELYHASNNTKSVEQLKRMIDELMYNYCTKSSAHERHNYWLEHPEKFKQDGDKWVYLKKV